MGHLQKCFVFEVTICYYQFAIGYQNHSGYYLLKTEDTQVLNKFIFFHLGHLQ
jgi:hypothetical protein